MDTRIRLGMEELMAKVLPSATLAGSALHSMAVSMLDEPAVQIMIEEDHCVVTINELNTTTAFCLEAEQESASYLSQAGTIAFPIPSNEIQQATILMANENTGWKYIPLVYVEWHPEMGVEQQVLLADPNLLLKLGEEPSDSKSEATDLEDAGDFGNRTHDAMMTMMGAAMGQMADGMSNRTMANMSGMGGSVMPNMAMNTMPGMPTAMEANNDSMMTGMSRMPLMGMEMDAPAVMPHAVVESPKMHRSQMPDNLMGMAASSMAPTAWEIAILSGEELASDVVVDAQKETVRPVSMLEEEATLPLEEEKTAEKILPDSLALSWTTCLTSLASLTGLTGAFYFDRKAKYWEQLLAELPELPETSPTAA